MPKEEVTPALKKFSLKDVKGHNNKNSIWIVIHNKVCDVTKFLEEHPGGEEILLEQAGKDGTELFEDEAHSTDARAMILDYTIGELRDEDKTNWTKNAKKWGAFAKEKAEGSTWKSWLIPMALALTASLVFRFLFLN